MQNKIIALAIAATLFTSQHAMAEYEEEGGIWVNATAQGNLPVENFRWFTEVQPRWRNGGKSADQLLLRPAVSYKLSPQTSIWLGYLNMKAWKIDGTPLKDEHRIWQQVLHNFEPIDTVHIMSRTRLEQRRLDGGSDTGLRLRQMIKLTMPLQDSPTVSWVLQDEYWFNFNDTDWGARRGYDQNRLFAGVAWAVSPKLIIETGYMNRYLNRPTKPTDRMDHILNTNLFFNF